MNTRPNPQAPLVAPCRKLNLSAPWHWFLLGLADARRAPVISALYGVALSLMLGTLAWMATSASGAWWLVSTITALVFLTPLICVGTYAVSAQLERGQTVSLTRSLRASFRRYLGNEMVYALALLIILLIWARADSMMSVFLPTQVSDTVPPVSVYLIVSVTIGLLFLSLIFAASVFALPMIMHRDVDSITAILTSINAVLRNKRVMLVWASLIGIGLSLGVASFGILWILFLPTIGYASWHGYLDTIDADDYARHGEGITATARVLAQEEAAE